MTNPTTPATQLDQDRLGREYAQLKATKTAAEKRMKEIEGGWREAFDFGANVAGPCKVSISHNVTRDDAAFRDAYPFETYPDFYKAVPDTDSIKDSLAPAEIRKFQREGAPKVTVTLFEA